MGLLKRNWGELQLYYRYLCRKLGIPGYQVHQIYLSDQKLIYIPIPKNACTSIKHALHEIEFGKRFDAALPEFSDYQEHHDYYKKRSHAFTSVSALRKRTDTTRFALIRDPVKRLISCYRNRVLDLGDLESSREILKNEGLPIDPDLNTFVLNLAEYRRINKSIEHHSRPQYKFLGGTIDYLDHIFTLRSISELEEMLQRFKPNLKLRQRKTGGTDVTLNDISREALDAAIEFYKKDYRLLGDYFSPGTLLSEFD